jgi:hypothetical protein
MGDTAVVHLSKASSGLSFYSTACGLTDDSLWVSIGKQHVTCQECLKATETQKKVKPYGAQGHTRPA